MLNPEQNDALRSVLDDPAAEAAAALNLRLAAVQKYISDCDQLVKANQQRLRSHHFVLSLAENAFGTALITVNDILTAVRQGKPIITVDSALRLVSVADGNPVLKDASARTAQHKSLELVFWGTYVFRLVAGRLVDERQLISSVSQLPLASPLKQPMSQFTQLLSDHYDTVLKREQRIRYWADRPRRILLSGHPGTTEEIFQRSLFWWLREYAMDALRVFAETNKFGQDSTDIHVVTSIGDYIVEIKWLGKNHNQQRYQQPPRIDEGLFQVGIYLDNDAQVTVGFLVVYDARSADQHRDNSDWDRSALHGRCREPYVVFLDSEPPSRQARKAAQKRRRPRRPRDQHAAAPVSARRQRRKASRQ